MRMIFLVWLSCAVVFAMSSPLHARDLRFEDISLDATAVSSAQVINQAVRRLRPNVTPLIASYEALDVRFRRPIISASLSHFLDVSSGIERAVYLRNNLRMIEPIIDTYSVDKPTMGGSYRFYSPVGPVILTQEQKAWIILFLESQQMYNDVKAALNDIIESDAELLVSDRHSELDSVQGVSQLDILNSRLVVLRESRSMPELSKNYPELFTDFPGLKSGWVRFSAASSFSEAYINYPIIGFRQVNPEKQSIFCRLPELSHYPRYNDVTYRDGEIIYQAWINNFSFREYGVVISNGACYFKLIDNTVP